jgi:hypothetical protein
MACTCPHTLLIASSLCEKPQSFITSTMSTCTAIISKVHSSCQVVGSERTHILFRLIPPSEQHRMPDTCLMHA